MKLKGLNIVIISPDRWGFIEVSKHHYAKELSKDNNVWFVDPPAEGDDEQITRSLNVLRNYKRVKGINKLPAILRKKLMRREVKGILKKVGGEIDVVWSFDSSRLYYLDLFGASLKIAHLVDFRENFFLKELSASADVCFATSDSIISNLKKFNTKVFKLQHGYSVPKETMRIELPGGNKVKGIYIGNLDITFLDWSAIEELSINYPNVDFVFVGPISDELKTKVAERTGENVIFIPKVPSEEVPSFLESASFCFQCYDERMFPEQLQNPHKMMQYLGAGKPIFASRTHEYIGLDLVHMYESRAELLKSFKTFIGSLDEIGSQKNCEKRRYYALDHTYANQVIKVEEIIKEM